ncbi:MAG TPA: hypothetical protein VFU05_10430, partial [Cyclobacteriaceae bacterium]|nr:hypothetical protein [Cyclobacteriaceae bacterium]
MKTIRILTVLASLLTSNVSQAQTIVCVGTQSVLQIPRNIGCGYGLGYDVDWDGAIGGAITNQSSGTSEFTVTWQYIGTFRFKRDFPGGCTGTPLYSPYYTVVANPSTPSPEELNQQQGTCGQVMLNYTGGASGFWQTTADGTDQAYPTSRTVTSTGTYFLRVINGSNCLSDAQSIIVASLPASPVGGTLSGGGTFYGSVNTNLNLSGHSGNIVEYRYTENGGGVNVVASTSSTLPINFSAPSSQISRQYWAVIELNGCQVNSSVAV